MMHFLHKARRVGTGVVSGIALAAAWLGPYSGAALADKDGSTPTSQSGSGRPATAPTVPPGRPLRFTLDLHDLGYAHDAGSPTGTVTFVIGPKVVGPVPVENWKATVTVDELPPGIEEIHARYSGDATHAPADFVLHPPTEETTNLGTTTETGVPRVSPLGSGVETRTSSRREVSPGTLTITDPSGPDASRPATEVAGVQIERDPSEAQPGIADDTLAAPRPASAARSLPVLVSIAVLIVLGVATGAVMLFPARAVNRQPRGRR